MAGSINMVMLIGRLGADPEIRRTNDGKPIATLRVATSEVWRDRNSGERREKTEWHRVVVFNEGLAKVAENYLKKGAQIMVQGKLVTRKWQDQSGADRYSTEVTLNGFDSKLQMLGDRNGGNGNSGNDRDDRGSRSGDSSGNQGGGGGFSRDMDDDIPFAPEWRL
jgi:single-strand DNA-binding protein